MDSRQLMTALAAAAAIGLASTPYDRPGRQLYTLPKNASKAKKRRRKRQQQARRAQRK